jgi:hypothetical protein
MASFRRQGWSLIRAGIYMAQPLSVGYLAALAMAAGWHLK